MHLKQESLKIPLHLPKTAISNIVLEMYPEKFLRAVANQNIKQSLIVKRFHFFIFYNFFLAN